MRLFVSMRYFLSHKRQSLVCIAGVIISVMMYISMSSLMNGFQDKFIVETVESSGHITMQDEPRETKTQILEKVYPQPDALLNLERPKPREVVKKIKNPEGIMKKLREMPGIIAVSPEVSGEAIATWGTKHTGLAIMGIEPEEQVRVTTIGEKVTDGDFSKLRTTSDGVVVGKGISLLLGCKLNDTITITSPTGGKTNAKVVGIFETGVMPVDYSRAYMLLNSAQTLLDKKNIINRLNIRTDDYTRAEAYAAQIESLVGYKTESWQENSANFLKLFKIQTIITNFISGAILVVAAFGVLNILIMSVLERINDIAILKSFGFSRNDITVIYLIQGLMIGFIGSVIGLILAKLSIEGLRKLPIPMAGLVKSERLLMSENPMMYVTAFVGAMIVVTLASMYPARRAAKYDPVEVIRGAH